MKHILLILGLILAAGFLAAETMPDFTLPDIENENVKLEDILNKGPVVVDFWATWCVPCKKGMAALNKLAEKYDSLTVIAVSIDAPKDVPKARTYLKTTGYNFVGLFDCEKKLAGKLNVVNPPHTFILDREGNIVFSHEGYEAGAEEKYEAKIRELLNLPEPETVKPAAEKEPCQHEGEEQEGHDCPDCDGSCGGCQ